jgi:hypothetical protein
VGLKVVLLDDRARPNLVDQFLLGDKFTVTFDESQQYLDGTLPEQHRYAVSEQLAAARQQAEGTKRISFGSSAGLRST